MRRDLSQRSINEIKRITWIGLFFNLGLSFIKFVLGFMGRSQAVIADAVHSLSDLTTDFAIILGANYWSKPPDEEHPYGHRRIETMVTLAISLVLMVIAFGIGYRAYLDFKNPEIRQLSWIAFLGALISIVVKEILYHWTIKVARKERSSALMANAWHHRTDALSSIPVALAVALATLNPQWTFLDTLGAFIVSLIIFRVSLKIIWGAFSESIDTGLSQRYCKRIGKIVLATEGVKSYHALRTRRVGSGWFVDFHIQVDPQLSVRDGHNISEVVKKNLFRKGSDILDVIVHLEPFE